MTGVVTIENKVIERGPDGKPVRPGISAAALLGEMSKRGRFDTQATLEELRRKKAIIYSDIPNPPPNETVE